MAAKARSSTELLIPNKKHYYSHTNNSSRTSSVDQESSKNLWVEGEQVNKSKRISTSSGSKIVEVIYYISSPNGNLQHPHFMEVTLPHSSHELYFKGTLLITKIYANVQYLPILLTNSTFCSSRCDEQIKRTPRRGNGQHVFMVFQTVLHSIHNNVETL